MEVLQMLQNEDGVGDIDDSSDLDSVDSVEEDAFAQGEDVLLDQM